MKIKGIDHLAINVRDMEKTVFFYGKLLNFRQLESVDMGNHKLTFFEIPGGGKLEFVEYYFKTPDVSFSSMEKGTARHLAFEVDDIFALERKLAEAGYPFHTPVSHVEQLGFSGGLTKDPNGFELEFLQYDSNRKKV